MLPQESLKQEAKELLDLELCFEDRLRDNEFLRAYSVPFIADLGALVQKHAARMGAASGHTCVFQVDHFGELLTWQLCEFLTQAGFEGESREAIVSYHQLDECHAASFFDWPPSPESE